jgi:SAM-dependent methyltransferase
LLSPLTATQDVEKLRTSQCHDIVIRWRNEFQIELGASFETIGEISLWRCNASGLLWYEPGAAAGDENLYRQLQEIPWYYMSDKWEFRTALTIIPKGARIVEIGIGFGYFLKMAREAGANAAGIELNAAAAAKAREAGFEVFTDDLESLSASQLGQFDAACSFQVLEHVSNPTAFIAGMIKLVKPGGLLILSVPNAGVNAYLDPDDRDLLDQPPHHLSKWSRRTFEFLPTLLPIDVQKIQREPLQSYHVDWYIDRTAARLERAFGARISKALINSFTRRIARRVLRSRFSRIIPGHTLLVSFRVRQ